MVSRYLGSRYEAPAGRAAAGCRCAGTWRRSLQIFARARRSALVCRRYHVTRTHPGVPSLAQRGPSRSRPRHSASVHFPAISFHYMQHWQCRTGPDAARVHRAGSHAYYVVTTAVQLDTVSVRYDYQNFKITGLTLAPS